MIGKLKILLLALGVAGTTRVIVGETSIRSADLMRLQVANAPELTRSCRVDPDGYLKLPLLTAPIKASGLTEIELEIR